MPRHRFGRADYETAIKKYGLRENEARDQLQRADMSLKNTGSLVNSMVMAAEEGRRDVDQAAIKDELLNETGKNLNALALYSAVNMIFDKLLPNGVYVNEKMHFHEHLTQRNFGNVRAKVEAKKITMGRDTTVRDSSFSVTEPITIVDSRTQAAFLAEGKPTPDKMNTLAGMLTLDQRVMAQLSVAASLVVQDIIDSVPSHEIPDPHSHYTTKRVIYVEDLINYIHSNFSQNITLDPDTNEAFERLSKGALSNFSRSLLKKFVDTAKELFQAGESIYFKEEADRTLGSKSAFVVGTRPSLFEHIYQDRLVSMCTVSKESVGKVWQSKPDDRSYPYDAVWMSVALMVKGNSKTVFGTRFNIEDVTYRPGTADDSDDLYDAIFDLVCSILSLVSMHVISYALSYAIDAYVRLAIRGAERVNGAILFTHENVITPQIIFPGIKASLEMYGVSPNALDKEVAFYLSTNEALMNLFIAAKKTYDADNSKPGVKRFSNPIAEDPYWTRDRSSLNAVNTEWEENKGRYNDSGVIKRNNRRGLPAMVNPSVTRYDVLSKGITASENADNIAKSVSTLRRISGQENMLRDRVSAGRRGVDIVGAAFGRSRRRGSKRRHSSKRSRKASFGKKRRGGSKKRRGSKKH